MQQLSIYSSLLAVAEYMVRGSKYTKTFVIRRKNTLPQAETAAYNMVQDYAQRHGFILIDYDLFVTAYSTPAQNDER